MQSNFSWSSANVAAHNLFYQQTVQNTNAAWVNKSLELKVRSFGGPMTFAFLSTGRVLSKPLQEFQFQSAGYGCLILGKYRPDLNGKTPCMVWAPQNDYAKLRWECAFIIEEYCEEPYRIPSGSVAACP
ncbi:uncharacterized protein LOC119398799 [Rhipicephalus sanguineus]|uniref:uncharacterized protein LOC119398799 n=1 Tax=Rhipicephalus sanguineus TaxID=34632 RepID=UPI0020C42BC3|nr:uncharacterized protein LOC119398799 [Rhipicephalus sanguineus]